MLSRKVNDHWGSTEVIRLRSHHVTVLSAGEAEFCINGEAVPLRRGTLLYTSPQCHQTFGFDRHHRPTVLTARFDLETDDPSSSPPSLPPDGCFLAVIPWKENTFLELMEQLHRCWIRRADPVAEKACSWLLQTMLWALCDEVSHSESNSWDQQMEEVKLMLDSDPEANVSIAELASACGISTEHFSRRFRRHAGTTAKNYQLQSRMRFARRLLQNEGLNVKEVASRLGYSDAFVFSRQFKKVWGVSPSNV